MEKAKVYSEIVAILDVLGNDFKKKIPEPLYSKILKEKSRYYSPIYDENIDLKDQNISKETAAFLSFLHYSYWCDNKEEKEEIKEILEQNDNSMKNDKPVQNNEIVSLKNDIFKKKEMINEELQLDLVKEKRGIFFRIKTWIKRIIGGKNE